MLEIAGGIIIAVLVLLTFGREIFVGAGYIISALPGLLAVLLLLAVVMCAQPKL